jgi:superfamily II DNA/RNA helicase
MADLGFLPVVRRVMDATPRSGQRLLFSATLDSGVDVLVQRYLRAPVVHEVDTAQSAVPTLTHHVLHVPADRRIDVVTDLAAAPGRTVVFTRTKRGAKRVTRQLSSRGVSAVELHGDLAQNARTRNLQAFSAGDATALVATDIAARGIHVDDVALVVHADPPTEHKAYLHRSGRTARAGESGTVVTIVLEEQESAVRLLMRQAGIRPLTTRVTSDHEILRTIAPGPRTYGVARGAAKRPEPVPAMSPRPRKRPQAADRPVESAVPRERARPRGRRTGPPARQHSPAGFSSSVRGR